MTNEYTITKRLMKSWVKGWWFNSIGRTALLIILCCEAIILIMMPFQIDYYLGYKVAYETFVFMYYVICHTFVLSVCLFIPVAPRIEYANPYNSNHQHNHYKTCSKNYCVKKWKRSIELTENEIIVDDEYSVLKFEYSAVKRVKERRKVVIIFLKSGFEIRLYKNAFVTGSWEECKKLLSSKSSINIK